MRTLILLVLAAALGWVTSGRTARWTERRVRRAERARRAAEARRERARAWRETLN